MKGLNDGVRLSNLPLTRRLLCQLSYAGLGSVCALQVDHIGLPGAPELLRGHIEGCVHHLSTPFTHALRDVQIHVRGGRRPRVP